MPKKGDFRENVIGFLQKALHELHQAAMYAQGVTHTEVRRLVIASEKLKEQIGKELADSLVEDREDAKRKAAIMQVRKETAMANRAKGKKK